MKKPVVAFLKDLKANKKLHSLDEPSIKQAVVLRLLSLLGWDIFDVDEVYPDYAAGSGTVSYALWIGDSARVFLEVKRYRDNLDEIHKHLLAFASRQEVELAVHTNGVHWWFLLSSAPGALNQKRCHSLNIVEQKPETVALDLTAFLSRDKVASGGHIESAHAALQAQIRKMAADVLPAAWNQLIIGPNKILVEILSEATERICGSKAEPEMVEEFIRSNRERWALSTPSPEPDLAVGRHPRASRKEAEAFAENSADIKTKKPEFFADKAIASFTFQGNTVPVKSWEEMLTTICDQFALEHSVEFEKVLWLYDDQKPCFSRYSDQLRIPEKIKKTNIYVETKLAPEEIVKTVGDLLTEFGYGHDELVITTQ